MSTAKEARIMPYEAKARIADNLFVQRRRAELSQGELGEAAMVTPAHITDIENGKSVGNLDTWIRLAGALSISLDDLLAGVDWTPGEIEFEIDAGYEVTFEPFADDQPEGGAEA
ncbi:MAG TPA: helix-turn-helix transcriptional regulator [Solirubrobacterales bacterium]|nr:helix-turn-helix transcriptional regulator [Solirubrobacterales bacterium]